MSYMKSKEMKRKNCLRIGSAVGTRMAVLIAVSAMMMWSCRKDDYVVPSDTDKVQPSDSIAEAAPGFYLLNEGNMGMNRSSLDYCDLQTGTYMRNIYAERNPTVVKELGDVGNDIGIYGSKLYIVVNCSHKVEVLDARTAVRLGQIDIPNCRSLCFHDGKVYVSSFVGPVQIDPRAPKGEVVRVDTTSLAITGRVTVGYQPEEMVVVKDHLYVANSGGYLVPKYDNTVSVVRLSDMSLVKDIPVGINLYGMLKDKYGQVWVTSRGNRINIPGALYRLTLDEQSGLLAVRDTIAVSPQEMALKGDTLLYFSNDVYNAGSKKQITYGMMDVRTRQAIAGSFVNDDTASKIKVPYLLSVDPVRGDIYVSDAGNYLSSGVLYCLDARGNLKWSTYAGDIPARMAFSPFGLK